MARSTHTEPYKILLEVLIEARQRADITQTELARRLNRPQPYVSMVERGERRVDVIQFYAIMKALGADPEAVFRELVAKLPDEVDV